MARINAMSDQTFQPNRRAVLAGLGAAALYPPHTPARSEEPLSAALRAKPDLLSLRDGEPATPVWSPSEARLLFKRGDRPQITLANDLAVPMALNCRGIDGV